TAASWWSRAASTARSRRPRAARPGSATTRCSSPRASSAPSPSWARSGRTRSATAPGRRRACVRPSSSASGGGRLVSWNVNSLTARLPRVLELLAEHAPDVACLQETRVADDEFPLEELHQAGYAAVHHGGGPRAGVALLTRNSSAPREVAVG